MTRKHFVESHNLSSGIVYRTEVPNGLSAEFGRKVSPLFN